MALIHLTFFLVVISAVSNLCIHDRLRCQPALSDVNLRGIVIVFFSEFSYIYILNKNVPIAKI